MIDICAVTCTLCGMSTTHLLDLIDEWRLADQGSDTETARRIGITRATLSLMRTHGIRALPNRTTLDGISDTTGQPYPSVLVAALRDAGHFDDTRTDRASAFRHG